MDGFTRIVRLGEGVSRTGRLSDDAMQRTIDALKQCRIKLEHHAPRRVRLIATEACRAATNTEDFLRRVREETGLDLEIVDRRTEAELAVTGCADLIDEGATGALMFDIGGGSSELAWLDFRGGRPKKQGRMSAAIRSWQSLPVGVVTIAEKFGGVDVTPERFEEMVAYVSGLLSQFKGRDKLRTMIANEPVHLIGTSGTVTTLAGLHLGLERYDRSKVDGLWMRSEDMVDTMRALVNMSYERRAGPSLYRPRPRRSGHSRLRHFRGDKARMADRPGAGRRQGVARRHADFSHRRGPATGRPAAGAALTCPRASAPEAIPD